MRKIRISSKTNVQKASDLIYNLLGFEQQIEIETIRSRSFKSGNKIFNYSWKLFRKF